MFEKCVEIPKSVLIKAIQMVSFERTNGICSVYFIVQLIYLDHEIINKITQNKLTLKSMLHSPSHLIRNASVNKYS